jgi:hypothetical protein
MHNLLYLYQLYFFVDTYIQYCIEVGAGVDGGKWGWMKGAGVGGRKRKGEGSWGVRRGWVKWGWGGLINKNYFIAPFFFRSQTFTWKYEYL